MAFSRISDMTGQQRAPLADEFPYRVGRAGGGGGDWVPFPRGRHHPRAVASSPMRPTLMLTSYLVLILRILPGRDGVPRA
jgi:hypothetical protein